jgi:hypothetical protein
VWRRAPPQSLARRIEEAPGTEGNGERPDRSSTALPAPRSPVLPVQAGGLPKANGQAQASNSISE